MSYKTSPLAQDMERAQEMYANEVAVKVSTIIEAKYPLIKNQVEFVNGKNYYVQEPSNVDTQNAFYIGRLHSSLITCVRCFAVDGTLI